MGKKVKIRVWISKYWATAGVYEAQANCDSEYDMAIVGDPGRVASQHFHGLGRQFHLTRQSAIERAEVERKRKIASLEKQIERLKAIEFNAKEERNG